jgi:hypothetical protein
MILKGGYMKRFKALQVCLAFMMLILGVLITGCGSDGQTGHWLPNDSEILDATRPRVTAVVPAAGAQNVPINVKTVTAAFSEAMDPTTLTVASFTLWCDTDAGNTTQIQITGGGAVTYLDAGYVATLPLPVGTNLPANVDCTATITSAATDVAGNQLAGNIALLPAASNFVWVFHTSDSEDTTAPSVISVYPADESEDICVNTTISATFDEAMDPTTIVSSTPGLLDTFTVMDTSAANADVPGIVTYDVGTNIATFTPTNDLTAGHVYTATITVAATDLADNPLDDSVVWSFTAGSTFCQAPVDLGDAQPYGVLASTAITLAGGDLTGLRVDGDVGIHPGSTCNGCTSIQVSGIVESGTPNAAAAKAALLAAYNDVIGRTDNLCTLGSDSLSTSATACGGINNFTYKPGLYRSGTSLTIVPGATIVLDAENDPNAVFIFQSGSTIDTIGGNTHVVLANGAQAKNIFWLAESSATIGGTTSDFAGTILALTSITVNTGTIMEGRALARNGAVTVQDGALITVPAP